jgi:hypothetical protein
MNMYILISIKVLGGSGGSRERRGKRKLSSHPQTFSPVQAMGKFHEAS